MVRRRESRSLVGDGVVYGVGLVLQRGLPIVLLPAVSRLLDRAELGEATAGLAVAGVLSIVFGLGFNFGIVRLYFDERADAPGAGAPWALLLRVQLVAAAALAATAWALGPLWSRIFDDVPWSGSLKASVLLGSGLACQGTALAALRAERRVTAFAGVIGAQVVAGGGLALALADRYGPDGFLWGLAAGSLVGAGAALTLARRPTRWSRSALWAGLGLSLPFVAHQVAGWVLSLSDRVLVERFLGLEDLARYHLAYALGSIPLLVTDAAQLAWLPVYYGADEERKRTLPGRVVGPAVRAMIGIAAIVALVAPAGVALLAPPGYDVPMGVVALVLAVGFVRVPYLIAFGVVTDARDSRVVARASMGAAAFNFAANLVVIPAWGLTGAAVTTLVSYAAMTFLLVRRAERESGTPFEMAGLARIAAVGVAATVALGLLPTGAFGWAIRSVLLVPAGLAAAAAVRHLRRVYRQP